MQKLFNNLASALKLPHHSLLKLKKYKGLIYNEEQEIGEINQIVDISTDIGGTGNIKNKTAFKRLTKIIPIGEFARNVVSLAI